MDNSIRIQVINDEPWFVASDVAKVLDYRMASDATRILDEDEKGTQNMSTPGGNQEMTMVNESGLYHLILKSRKSEAKQFRKWVTQEVLPQIRKTGGYNLDPTLVPQTPQEKQMDLLKPHDLTIIFYIL